MNICDLGAFNKCTQFLHVLIRVQSHWCHLRSTMQNRMVLPTVLRTACTQAQPGHLPPLIQSSLSADLQQRLQGYCQAAGVTVA